MTLGDEKIYKKVTISLLENNLGETFSEGGVPWKLLSQGNHFYGNFLTDLVFFFSD